MTGKTLQNIEKKVLEGKKWEDKSVGEKKLWEKKIVEKKCGRKKLWEEKKCGRKTMSRINPTTYHSDVSQWKQMRQQEGVILTKINLFE